MAQRFGTAALSEKLWILVLGASLELGRLKFGVSPSRSSHLNSEEFLSASAGVCFCVVLPGLRFYCRLMKRISFFLMTALLAAPVISPAQDAATEERLNKLSAQIDVLVEAKEAQNKKIDALEKQVQDLQTQLNKPSGNYASAEDLKQVAEAVKEVDKKRQADSEQVVKELEKLGKTLAGGGSGAHRTSTPTEPKVAIDPAAPHFEYTVQAGDTPAAIVKAYRDKNIKVTLQQILAANPGLKPEKMKVGQKIIIPAPQ
jgi:LysM repeat protein